MASLPEDEEEETEMDTEAPPAKKTKKSPAKKKKKSNGGLLGITFPMTPKNPVALLNELRQNLTFDLISQTGPVHAPVFTMKVVVSVHRLFLPRRYSHSLPLAIFQVDGATFSGEGRSKKQAKLVAAKNALSTLLAQNNQQQQQLLAPFPTIEFNRGVVEVDFTSDDPTDANFIINEMNRIQTTSNQMFPDAQMPLTAASTPTTGPLSVLPGNNMNGNGATMRPPSIKAGNTAREEGGVEVEVDDGRMKEESIHDDSGQGAEDMSDDIEMEVQEEEPMDEDNDEEEHSEDDQEAKEDVEITPEILEIIRMSVEHYIDYDLEIQRK